ncbi:MULTISPECIES: hypothetical protein [Streptomyces]|uniref:hypothetical protein n=1 Tax=Streptomyces TaxID=1883 RepID=UPI0003A78E7D|nr:MULTISPECIES: hypothetical protein [Streptomyces]
MLAAAVAARALALNHEPEQARAALTAADAFMSRLPEADRSDTWLTYGEQKHHVHLSHAFTTRSMTRTLLNIVTAACSHHDGGTEQTCRRTVDALTALPVDFRTGPVRRRALDLFEAIPAQHHREQAVRELRDVVTG